MVYVMERNPNSFAGMDEETLRDHILVQLNGSFEGKATGETFNGEGKTDILIREQGRNLFIGECKFWKGAKSLRTTIDQLLSYTVWRDTKTAIILFNRNKDLSSVLEQIPSVVKNHPNCERVVVNYKRESAFRFAMAQRDDRRRHVLLTILVFNVPV